LVTGSDLYQNVIDKLSPIRLFVRYLIPFFFGQLFESLSRISPLKEITPCCVSDAPLLIAFIKHDAVGGQFMIDSAIQHACSLPMLFCTDIFTPGDI